MPKINKFQVEFDYEEHAPTESFMRNFVSDCFSKVESISVIRWVVRTTQDIATVRKVFETHIASNGKYTRGKLNGVEVYALEDQSERPSLGAPDASTAITIKNTSDTTILATLNLGVTYGQVALNPGDVGQLAAEWVWYTVNTYQHASNMLLAQKRGVYGGKHVEFYGSNGDYKIKIS